MNDYRSRAVPDSLAARYAHVHALPEPPATLGQLTDQLADILSELAATQTVESMLCCTAGSGHQVDIDGQTIHTHCVLDALLIPALRNQPATIHSTSPQSGRTITIAVTDDGFTSTPLDAVISLGVAAHASDTVYETTCPYINAFDSLDDYDGWTRSTPDVVSMAVTVEDAINLAKDVVTRTARYA